MAIPESDGTVRAIFYTPDQDISTGVEARFLDSSLSVPNHYTEVTWNQTGPQGPPGSFPSSFLTSPVTFSNTAEIDSSNPQTKVQSLSIPLTVGADSNGSAIVQVFAALAVENNSSIPANIAVSLLVNGFTITLPSNGGLQNSGSAIFLPGAVFGLNGGSFASSSNPLGLSAGENTVNVSAQAVFSSTAAPGTGPSSGSLVVTVNAAALIQLS